MEAYLGALLTLLNTVALVYLEVVRREARAARREVRDAVSNGSTDYPKNASAM